MTITNLPSIRLPLCSLFLIILAACGQSNPDPQPQIVAEQNRPDTENGTLNTDLPATAPPATEASATATLPGPVIAITDPPTATPTITLTPSQTPPPTDTPTITPEPPAFAWLDLLNDYRTAAGLDPVGYDFELSANALAHSEYMGRNDTPAAKSQEIGAPYYTPNGSQAAVNSLVFSIDSPDGTDLWALDYWFSAPFQALTLLDPDLQRIGYGRFRDDFGGVKIAYALDTLSGNVEGSGRAEYPIFYPSNGGTSYFTNQSFGEYPDPTRSCPGYEKPVGPPLILQLGDGSRTPNVSGHRLTVNGIDVESCLFDETSFRAALDVEQALGRQMLDTRDAIVIIPERPIGAGSTVRAEINVDGEVYSWSYDVVEPPFIPMEALPRSAPDWTVGDSVQSLGWIDIRGFDYGGQTHDLQNPARMQQAGMTWVKFQLKWRPDSVPSEINEKLGRAKAAGFKVLVSVTGDPYPSSIDYAAFVRFMDGLAKLSPAPDAIEVWNEMNIDFEWPPGEINPATYTEQMLAPSYRVIKAANPNIMVISGAPAPTGFDNGTNAWANSRYMNGMVEAGAVNYLDCIGIHFNEGATPPAVDSGHPAGEYFGWYFIPSMQNTFFAFGGEKPLCFTELGYLSGDGYGGLPDRFWWARETSANEAARWLYESLGLAYQSGYVELAIIFNVDIFHYEADPQGGFAILRPGGGCPFCDTVAQ